MCMEDIRISRELDTNYKTITVPAATLTQVVSADPKRISLAFGPTATQVYFQPGPSRVADATGFGTLSADGPLTLHIEDFGQAICQDWWAWSPVAVNVVTIVENTLQRQ